MPRKLRVEFPGAIYHVMSRGDRREDIFRDDVDRQDFLKPLAEACQKTGFQVHACCLMGNHFHLVVETPEAALVSGMKWLPGTYTSRLNRRHKAVRVSVQRPLQVVDRGWEWQRLFADGLRLCAFESSARPVAGQGGEATGIPVEQLWRVLEASRTPTGLLADRLGMVTKTHLAHLLYWQSRNK